MGIQDIDVNKIQVMLSPRERVDFNEWVERNIVLDTKSSSQPGPYRFALTPFLREIAHEIVEKPNVRVVIKKSAQVGLTQLMLNIIAYYQCIDPSPVMYVTSTLALAETTSSTRFDPMIKRIPFLVTNSRRDTVRLKEFSESLVLFAGANSPVTFRSIPIKVLILDEVDSYPLALGSKGGRTEGSPIALAEARTRTFEVGEKKIIEISTPIAEGTSVIDSSFELSDQRYYQCPCPKCDKYQKVEFENLNWNRSDYNLVYLECIHCGHHILEDDKTVMLERGKWVKENEDKGFYPGFQLNSLLSPKGWSPWSEIAMRYETSKNNEDLKQSFYNTILGKSYLNKLDMADPERIKSLMETSDEIGDVPEWAKYVTGSIDVQGNRVEVMACAWGRNLRCHVFEHKIMFGNLEKEEFKEEVNEWISCEHRTKLGFAFKKTLVAIDSSFNTSLVYSFCRRHNSKQVIPIKGQEKLSQPFSGPRYLDRFNFSNRVKRMGVALYNVGIDLLKERLYRSLNLDSEDIRNESIWNLVTFAKGFDEEFYLQLTAEKRVYKKRADGTIKSMWVNVRRRNEVLDLLIYNKACAYIANLETRMRRDEKVKLSNTRVKNKLVKKEITEKVIKDEVNPKVKRTRGEGFGNFFGDL